MKVIYKPAKVWYLAIDNPSINYHNKVDFEARRQFPVNIEKYKSVYKEVGGPWDWSNRLAISQKELQAILEDEANEIYYCYYKGQFAGYFEIDCHQESIELVYFGLSPLFIGKGLGKQMIKEVIFLASKKHSPRLWLHTCEFDSPQALAFYQKSGFSIFDEKIEDQTIIIDKAY